MKSKGTTLILCLLFGWMGIHRFYVGKWLSGLIQMLTFGGFMIWWAIDLLVILIGKFRDSSGAIVGQTPSEAAPNVTTPIHSDSTLTSTTPSTAQDWLMKAKPTSGLKFLLGANVMKSYQLDYVEKKGDVISVAVLSGKLCHFRIGEFNGKYIKTSAGNRDFTFKSTAGTPQKIVFRETLLQMPEKWWDELELKLGASESGLSKVLHGATDLVDGIS